jgi:predicted enzyme related to lactoylglutathione lyase
MSVLINIDVPDVEAAVAFYGAAFGLTVNRRFGADGAELAGWPSPVFLLRKASGSIGAAGHLRGYERHWTPVHLDVVVDEIEAALARVLAAGAKAEGEIKITRWGKLVLLSDPFGHGLCLVEFLGSGYDEIADEKR